MVLLIFLFQKSFTNSKEAVCYSFMVGEYIHAQFADGEMTHSHFQKCSVLAFPKIFRDADHVEPLWASSEVLGIYKTGRRLILDKI